MSDRHVIAGLKGNLREAKRQYEKEIEALKIRVVELEKELGAAKKPCEVAGFKTEGLLAVGQRLIDLEAECEQYRSVIGETIKAWESLLGNKHYPPAVIAEWLKKEMAPALKALRRIFRKKG